MTDNGTLDGFMDTTGGTQWSTRVAERMASAPTAAPATTPVVRFAARSAGSLASPTITAVTATTPLTTPQGDFAIQLQKITQGFSVGLGTPQPFEVLLTLAGAPKCGAGTQPNPMNRPSSGHTNHPRDGCTRPWTASGIISGDQPTQPKYHGSRKHSLTSR